MNYKEQVIALPNLFEGMTQGSTHKLAYVEWGDPTNTNVIVCVHGLTRNSRDFDVIANVLSTHYRVLAVDVVGRGKSDWLDNKQHYNYATYVADILAFFDALGLPAVDWLGTSMGGLLGMMLAAHHPERIKKLFINDIGPFIPAPALQRIEKYVSITPFFTDRTRAEDHVRTILAPFGIRQASHWEHIFTHSLHSKDQGWVLAYDPAIANAFKAEDGKPIGDIALWDLWDAIESPVMVMRGGKSDTLLPETLQRMQRSGPRAKAIEIPDVGHAPSLMNEEEIKPIYEWFKGV